MSLNKIFLKRKWNWTLNNKERIRKFACLWHFPPDQMHTQTHSPNFLFVVVTLSHVLLSPNIDWFLPRVTDRPSMLLADRARKREREAYLRRLHTFRGKVCDRSPAIQPVRPPLLREYVQAGVCTQTRACAWKKSDAGEPSRWLHYNPLGRRLFGPAYLHSGDDDTLSHQPSPSSPKWDTFATSI